MGFMGSCSSLGAAVEALPCVRSDSMPHGRPLTVTTIHHGTPLEVKDVGGKAVQFKGSSILNARCALSAEFALEDAIGSHACSLEVKRACV
jgi:hypothetical protein